MIIIFKQITLVFMLLVTGICFSQIDSSKSEVSKSLFSQNNLKDYFPIGITAGINHNYWSNTSSGANYEKLDNNAIAFGLGINVLNYKGFNLRTGFIMKNSPDKTYFSVTAAELGVGFGLTVEITETPNWTYHIPIDIEYLINLSPNIIIAPSLGYEIQYYGFTGGKFEFVELSVDNIDRIVSIGGEREKDLTSGLNLNLSFKFLRTFGMLDVNFKYHHHFVNIYEQNTRVINLEISPDTISNHNWTGHYTGVTLSFFPKFK